MFVDLGIPVDLKFMYPFVEVPAGFSNITNFTVHTFKGVNNLRLQIERNSTFVAEEVTNLKSRKNKFDINISTVIVDNLPKLVLINFGIPTTVR